MKRFIFTSSTVLSGAICIGVIALWVRSYWRGDSFDLNLRNSFIVESAWGELAFRWETDSGEDVSRFWRGPHKIAWSSQPAMQVGGLSGALRHGGCGFAWDNYDRVHAFVVPSGQAMTRERVVVVPDWFLVLILGTLPVMRILAWRRQRRRKSKGLCLRCGYDLRGSDGICPECGSAIERASDAHAK
jgi:hypothetical protein